MSHYKRQAASNRDALFGNAASASGPSKPAVPRATNNAPTLAASSVSTTSPISKIDHSHVTPGSLKSSFAPAALTGSAKDAKMKEAEDFRSKAKKAMAKSLFSNPNPIEGQMYYGKAADAYKRCGEIRLEKLCRVAYAECLDLETSFASAGAQYVLAAELAWQGGAAESLNKSEVFDECHLYYTKASEAWRNAGQLGRAGEAVMKGALSLLGDDKDTDDFVGGRRLSKMDRKILSLIEEAVEIHVPDPLNRYKNFRQTGKSVYVGIKSTASKNSDVEFDEVTLDSCRSNVITTSFAHETLFKCVYKLLEWNELHSAIYTAGAASYILESDGISSISLARAYCVETVLSLALGDVVAADRQFMHHIQNTAYLSSRECELSEDMIRAIKIMDYDLLEEARAPGGKNKSALSNLHRTVQSLVSGLRVSGVAKKKAPIDTKGDTGFVPSVPDIVYDDDEYLQASLDANFAEMDDLMNDMGLNSDGEDDRKIDHDSEDDEDDFDLR